MPRRGACSAHHSGRGGCLLRQASGCSAAGSSHGWIPPDVAVRIRQALGLNVAGESGSVRRVRPRPNAAVASRAADSYISTMLSRSRAALMPRPPPAECGFTTMGRPCSSAANNLIGRRQGPWYPGTRGARSYCDVAGSHHHPAGGNGLGEGGQSRSDQRQCTSARTVRSQKTVAGVYSVSTGRRAFNELVHHQVRTVPRWLARRKTIGKLYAGRRGQRRRRRSANPHHGPHESRGQQFRAVMSENLC